MSTITIPADPVPEAPARSVESGPSQKAARAGWSDSTLVALLLLATLVCYANILGNSFVYDDGQQILQNPYVKSWHFVPQIFGTTVWSFVGQAGTTNYYRPLMTFTFLVLWHIFGLMPFGFHLFSLLMQFAVVTMLFYAGCRLFKDVRMAWLAALLFAVHPIHTEAVAWIASVPDLEASFLLLLALWLLAADGEWNWKIGLGTLVCFALALLCKEPALMFAPLAVVFEHLAANDRAETTLRQKALRYAPLCALGVLYLFLRVALFGKLAPVLQRPRLTWPETIYSAFALILDYTRLLLWPARLSAFHVFHASTVPGSPRVIGGVVIFVLCVAALLFLRKRAPAAAFAVLWLGVTLGPVLNARWMASNVLAERYLYLPSIGFCWLMAWCAVRLWDALPAGNSARLGRVALAGVLGTLVVAGAAATMLRNRVWQNELQLYTRTLETDPDAHIIRSNLGGVYFGLGDLARAGKEWEQALAGKPDSVNTMNSLGILYREQGRFAASHEMLERAIAAKPQWTDPHFNLGQLLQKEGNDAEALREFATAVELAPFNPTARYWYGHALLRAHRYAEAEAELQQSAALAPEASFGALCDLVTVYLATSQTEQAATLLRHIVADYPYDSKAHFELAQILEAQGQTGAAVKEYQQGLSLEPGNAEAAGAVRRLRISSPLQ
jgi:tetratricopeptide (TPR) repeat protein